MINAALVHQQGLNCVTCAVVAQEEASQAGKGSAACVAQSEGQDNGQAVPRSHAAPQRVHVLCMVLRTTQIHTGSRHCRASLRQGAVLACNSAPEADQAGLAVQRAKPPRAPLVRELGVLYWRTLTEIVRNPTLLAMHCAMALVMGFLCGGIFYHISNDIAGAQNRLGACASRALCLFEQFPGDHAGLGRAPAVRSEASDELVRGGAGAVFFSLVFLALTSLTTVDLLVNERGLVVKETLGGYYRPISYYLSKGADSPSAAAHTLNALPIC